MRAHREDDPDDPDDPDEPGLARFAGPALTQPAVFGAGAERAIPIRRRDVVAYGYLAVVEGYASPDSDTRWRVLTLTLPGRVPTLTVDHRSALGRPGVAVTAASGRPCGDAMFDAVYLVHGDDAAAVARVLTPAVRQLLIGLPVQRFTLSDKALSLRTFDGAAEDDRLAWLAGSILASAPSFVSTSGWSGNGGVMPIGDAPLLPGVYGEDDTELTAAEVGRARSRRINAALVALAAVVVAAAAVVVLVLT